MRVRLRLFLAVFTFAMFFIASTELAHDLEHEHGHEENECEYCVGLSMKYVPFEPEVVIARPLLGEAPRTQYSQHEPDLMARFSRRLRGPPNSSKT